VRRATQCGGPFCVWGLHIPAATQHANRQDIP
jgi:hypothetical protein